MQTHPDDVEHLEGNRVCLSPSCPEPTIPFEEWHPEYGQFGTTLYFCPSCGYSMDPSEVGKQRHKPTPIAASFAEDAIEPVEHSVEMWLKRQRRDDHNTVDTARRFNLIISKYILDVSSVAQNNAWAGIVDDVSRLFDAVSETFKFTPQQGRMAMLLSLLTIVCVKRQEPVCTLFLAECQETKNLFKAFTTINHTLQMLLGPAFACETDTIVNSDALWDGTSILFNSNLEVRVYRHNWYWTYSDTCDERVPGTVNLNKYQTVLADEGDIRLLVKEERQPETQYDDLLYGQSKRVTKTSIFKETTAYHVRGTATESVVMCYRKQLIAGMVIEIKRFCSVSTDDSPWMQACRKWYKQPRYLWEWVLFVWAKIREQSFDEAAIVGMFSAMTMYLPLENDTPRKRVEEERASNDQMNAVCELVAVGCGKQASLPSDRLSVPWVERVISQIANGRTLSERIENIMSEQSLQRRKRPRH